MRTTITHPLDTMAKRLQNNKEIKFSYTMPRILWKQLHRVFYPTSTSSLWTGYSAALVYRTTCCTLTFGSQPLVEEYLQKKHGKQISQYTGQQRLKITINMLSGMMFGVMETLLLPLDRWKVLRQLHDKTLLSTLFWQEGFALYNGAGVTLVRNMKAFPSLYVGSHLSDQYILKISPTEEKTFAQRSFSSFIGATAAMIVSNPTDMIKTRLQAQRLTGESLSSIQIGREIIKKTGVSGLFQGLVPRFLSIAPRITFMKALSEHLTPKINQVLENTFTPKPGG